MTQAPGFTRCLHLEQQSGHQHAPRDPSSTRFPQQQKDRSDAGNPRPLQEGCPTIIFALGKTPMYLAPKRRALQSPCRGVTYFRSCPAQEPGHYQGWLVASCGWGWGCHPLPGSQEGLDSPPVHDCSLPALQLPSSQRGEDVQCGDSHGQLTVYGCHKMDIQREEEDASFTAREHNKVIRSTVTLPAS
ncbi:hypothetical protein H1C71_041765 [Ictidomys tridecemlineatus]|nr:hypothetical protein H1C71_041765 [Ictidomys tridecemlineatus]